MLVLIVMIVFLILCFDYLRLRLNDRDRTIRQRTNEMIVRLGEMVKKISRREKIPFVVVEELIEDIKEYMRYRVIRSIPRGKGELLFISSDQGFEKLVEMLKGKRVALAISEMIQRVCQVSIGFSSSIVMGPQKIVGESFCSL
jgi:hypothetical protein